MKKLRSLVCVLLVMCTLLATFAVTASAASTTAFSVLSSSRPAKVFSIGAGDTIPYTSDALSTRGTVSYGASRYSYIAASDEIYVYEVGKNGSGTYWAYVSYPTSSRRVYAYIPLSAISPNNSSHAKTTASARFNVSVRPGSGTSSSYYVDKGDPVWLLAVSGSNYQIMYPSGSSAYRIAWIAKSTYDSYCAPSTPKIVSDAEIDRAAAAYGISRNSNAYNALKLINTKYADSLSGRTGSPLVFFFEGVGSNSSCNARMNAMCVVVKAGRIVFIDRNSSTIPDYPFDPARNDGTPMPTVKSGIYSFRSIDHLGKYAALTVKTANVLRHRSKSSFYSSTSEGIDVHRRSTDSIAPAGASWVNSAGCLIVGRTPDRSTGSAYAAFLQALGVVGSSGTAYSHKTGDVSGYVIVDRTYAKTYLSGVGYSTRAIA
ncbi:MAG: hypothetical protein IK095_00565, partial [Oscillospiraceae bacterium]|nr:hypothetical protein [Oscillospiraceae bacterium]